MKKRVLSILLAVLLATVGLLMTAHASDSYDDAVLQLAALADTADPENGGYFFRYSAENGGCYEILRTEEQTALRYSEGERSLLLVLPEQYTALYTLSAAGEGASLRVTLEPESYTEQTALEPEEAEGDELAVSTLQAWTEQALPELVELTGVVCDDRGVLSQLGFTAFTRHLYHFYDEGVITQEPSCVAEGVLTYTCSYCGQTRTEAIPATGEHSWDKGVLSPAPDCTADGTRQYTCTVCGQTREEPVAALGHAWTLAETTSEVETVDDPHGTARFVCSRCGASKTGKRCAGEIFTDMPTNWSHTPIEWAYFNGITSGVSDNRFSPKESCTRAQIVTFLWSAAGKPAPTTKTNPFKDVKKTSYYYDAVLWAVENGITTGKSATRFAPKDECTRAQIVTFLWSAAGKPAPTTKTNPFKDVKKTSYYYDAVLWAVENGITSGKSATTFVPNKACTRAEAVTFLYSDSRRKDSQATWSQSFPLYYADTALKTRALCRSNRIYVEQAELEQSFGKAAGATQWPVITKFGHSYISLADAAEQYGLGVEFRQADSSIHLYRLEQAAWTTQEATGQEKPAHIRLEDIMADYGLNKRFTHDGLIRLRFFGDYLQAKSDCFYIAWISKYVNPPERVENDISTTFNFYNADFTFTLDSLILDGGRIGLHGYTHQDHDSVSAVGFEFGVNNEMTEEEILDRFARAEKIATDMGYTWYFFEFPHYATTALQREVAEKHFTMIYEPHPEAAKKGQIETHSFGSHVCRWVPTPGGYVNGRSDRDRFCATLEQCKNRKDLMSFYIHPYVDTRFIDVQTEGTQMRCSYDESVNILPVVIRLLTEWGYRLGPL